MYSRPADLTDALRLAAEPNARVLAGGTDIFPATGERLLSERHVDVTALEALRGISVQNSWIRLGAAATWSEIAKADLPRAFNALRAAAREIGGVQIQNRGTIAGNLCILIEDAASVGPFGAKGVGEQALIPTAPAILNAIHYATGARIRRTPVTPDRLRAAILALQGTSENGRR